MHRDAADAAAADAHRDRTTLGQPARAIRLRSNQAADCRGHVFNAEAGESTGERVPEAESSCESTWCFPVGTGGKGELDRIVPATASSPAVKRARPQGGRVNSYGRQRNPVDRHAGIISEAKVRYEKLDGG